MKWRNCSGTSPPVLACTEVIRGKAAPSTSSGLMMMTGIDKAHGITAHAGLHWKGDLRLDMASFDACNDEVITVRLEDIKGGDGEVHLVSI